MKITNSQFSGGAAGEGQDQCEGYSMKADKSVPKPSFHPGITQNPSVNDSDHNNTIKRTCITCY